MSQAGKVIAGIACGAGSALSGGSFAADYAEQLLLVTGADYGAILTYGAPLSLLGLAIVLCALSPTVLSAWMRGAIMLVCVSFGALAYVGQCFGMELAFDQMDYSDELRAAMAEACPPVPSSVMLTVQALMVVGGAVAAVLLWRRICRDQVPEF